MTNSFSKKTIFIIPAVILGLLFFSPALASEDCNIKIEENLNKLLKIKDNYYIYGDEKVNSEYEARKNLLSSIISCSKEEVSDLKKNLEDIKKLNEENEKIREYFISNLDKFREYFQSQEKTFEEIKKNKEKIKILAKEIFEWRQSTYNPLIKNAVNFSFVFKQDSIISTTENRLNKINNSLKIILSVRNKEISDLLKSAQEKIETAQNLNQEAFEIINKDIEPIKIELRGETATTTSSLELSKNTKGSTDNKIIKKNINEPEINPQTKVEKVIVPPQDLIKKSLDNIRDAYKDFFELSTVVKNLLGF